MRSTCTDKIHSLWKKTLMNFLPVAWSNRVGDVNIDISYFNKYKMLLKANDKSNSIITSFLKILRDKYWFWKWLTDKAIDLVKQKKTLVPTSVPTSEDFRKANEIIRWTIVPVINDLFKDKFGDFSVIWDWKWNSIKRITNSRDLKRFFDLLTDEDKLNSPLEMFKFVDAKSFYELVDNASALSVLFWVNKKLTKTEYLTLRSVVDAYTNRSPLDVAFSSMWTRWKIIRWLTSWEIYATAQVLSVITWHATAYIWWMMAIQILWIWTEFKSYSTHYSHKWLSKFREEFDILWNAWFEYFNDWTFIHVYNNVKDVIKKTYPHYYNLFEKMFEWTRVNQALDFVLKEKYFNFDNLDDLTKYIKSLPAEEQIDFLSTLRKDVEDRYKDTSSFFIRDQDNHTILNYWNRLPDWMKATWIHLRTFLWHFGAWQLRNWYDIIKRFSSDFKYNTNFEKYYLEVLTEKWYKEAKEFAYQLYRSNSAFLDLISKISIALHMWFYISRNVSDEEDYSYADTVMNWVNYAYPLQFLNTTQIGREILNFFVQTFADHDHDWKTTRKDLQMAAYSTLNQFLNNISKQYLTHKAVAWWVWKMMSATGNPLNKIIEWWKYWIETMLNNSQWFAYYFEEEMDKWWYDLHTPYSNHDFLLKILWYWNEYIKKVREMATDKQLQYLVSWDEDQRNKSFNSRLLYRMPFFAQYQFWTFDEIDFVKKLQVQTENDEWYQNYIKWNPDLNIDKDMWEFAYYKLIELNKFDTKAKDQDWFEDLRANFITKDWDQLIYKQWKEDLFVNKMLSTLEEWDKEKFIKQFNNAIDSKWKAYTQALAFLESWWYGSAKEYVWAIVNDEFVNLAKQYNAWKDPEKLKNIRSYLWKKYWKTLYLTDKLNYSELWMYYIRQHIKWYEDKISNPYNENWNPTKSMKFIFSSWNKNNTVSDMYLLDTISRIETAWWNPDWYKIANVFSQLFLNKYYDSKNDDHLKIITSNLNSVYDFIDNSTLDTHTKETIKQSLFIPLKSDLVNIQKNKKYDKDKSFNDIMNNLFWTIKKSYEISELINNTENLDKELVDKNNWKDYNYKWNTNYYTKDWYYNPDLHYDWKKYKRMNDYIYKQFSKLKNSFTYYNYKSYGTNYYRPSYTRDERDYLQWYVKNQYYLSKALTTTNASRPPKKYEKWKWRLTKQFQWFAQPWWIKRTYDIIEPTDRDKRTVKQSRRRKAIKYDPSKTRRHVTKWAVSSIFSKKGLWGSRVSRSKRSNNRRSKNKSSNRKRSS